MIVATLSQLNVNDIGWADFMIQGTEMRHPFCVIRIASLQEWLDDTQKPPRCGVLSPEQISRAQSESCCFYEVSVD